MPKLINTLRFIFYSFSLNQPLLISLAVINSVYEIFQRVNDVNLKECGFMFKIILATRENINAIIEVIFLKI